MTKKYISPEHAIRNVMGSEKVNKDETITEQAAVAAPKLPQPNPYTPNKYIAPPTPANVNTPKPTTMPKFNPYSPNVGGTPPTPANVNTPKQLPTIQKRDFLKDIGSFFKLGGIGVATSFLSPELPATETERIREFSKEYWKRVNAGEDPEKVKAAMNAKPAKTLVVKPGWIEPLKPAETTPAEPAPAEPATVPEPFKAPVYNPASPPKPFKAPVYEPATVPEPFKAPVYNPASPPKPDAIAGILPIPGINNAVAPATKPNKDANKKDGKPTRGSGFGGALAGVSTPGQSGISISGFESPDYLHMAKTRLADKSAQIVKENTADDERRAIENVPRPKSDRNKSMTRNQEIKKKIIDENVKKKLIIKDAVKNGKDKNYSVEINPEYKHEKLSD